MAQSSSGNRTPVRTKGPRPSFVPDGWLALLNAFDKIGQSLFGESWTGQELDGPAAKEIRRAREAKDSGTPGPSLHPYSSASDAEAGARRMAETWDKLRRLLHSETVSCELLTEHGYQHAIRRELWAGKGAERALVTGRANVASDWNSTEGWVIVEEESLDRAIAGADKKQSKSTHESSEITRAAEKIYETEYMALLRDAIEEFGISEDNQPKAEVLSQWFQQRTVDGQNISASLARSMATIVRLAKMRLGGAHKQKR